MEIPGHGLVQGEWDLRGKESQYLGNVPVHGKRVLEIGTASGYLCGHMEALGASVVAHDLSPEDSWDIVPYAHRNLEEAVASRKSHIAALNAGWWFNWKARKSSAQMVYGSVYSIPGSIGEVDIVTFGSILLHLRDPFLALWNGTRLSKSTVIVTDILPRRLRPFRPLIERSAIAGFAPGARASLNDTWWWQSPGAIKNMLGVLGFEETKITYHTQSIGGSRRRMFTIVGKRTSGHPDPNPVP